MPAFADLSLHVVSEGSLLLDPTHHRLYALNASAAFIWSLLKDGKSPEEASRSLSVHFAVPVDEAAAYVADVLRQYDSPPDGPIDAPIDAPPDARISRRRPPPNGACVIETYALLGSVFRVHYDSAGLAKQIHPLLQHGTRANGAWRANVIDVAVGPESGGVAIIVDEKEIGSSRALEDAAVAVRACLTQLAVAASGGLCVVHAGALCRNGAALLLPGQAGHGKSTLSAGLAARGFQMLSDDTTLLAGEPPLVRSLPTGLCIKRGAYPVLEPHFPQLASLPEWRRPDGKQARYLMPGNDLPWAAPDAAAAVRWIVFPRYHPAQGTALLPLPRHEAMARLLHGVCFLSGSLDKRNLDEFIAWIEQIDCFELPLSSLDAATALIDGLCI
ncbi:MAG: PqqD family peptide modification chaperone [Rhodospirillales bacterium]|nr:PqqD family peptide modification chaperone [Rhodospirillales bacterium]